MLLVQSALKAGATGLLLLVAGSAGAAAPAGRPTGAAAPRGTAPAPHASSAAPAAPALPGEADRAGLVEAERAFARAADEKGVREAFLEFLADDAVLFRPGPVPGKEWMRSHPAPAFRLTWRPSFVEVSAAGDLGYTLGPYEVRAGAPPPASPSASPPKAAANPPAGNSPAGNPPASNRPAPGAGGPSAPSAPPVRAEPPPMVVVPPVPSAAGAPAGTPAAAPGGPSGHPAPIGYGHFVTVWRKQPDGTWRVAVDWGNENPPPPGAAASGSVVEHGRITGASGAPVDPEAARAELLAADRAFAAASLAKGTRAAYVAYLADDARILRDGLMPISGRAAIRKAFASSQRPELLVWEPMRAEVARSGDLGYTYGSSGVKANGPHGMTSDPGFYLRIWEKQPGGWRVVLDLLRPSPPPAPPRLVPSPTPTPPPPSRHER